MAKRHFFMQAHKHAPKHAVAGQYMSEKLDGQRAFWDGGITRGLRAIDVPWANTLKDTKIRMATGLWSRYGKPIHAPEWWLDQLPVFPLDGELWRGRGQFQKTRSTVSKHVPIDAEWAQVQYVVFDSPTLEHIFYDSIIDWPQFQKELVGCLDWISNKGYDTRHHYHAHYRFVLKYMQESVIERLGGVSIHNQILLPTNAVEAMEAMNAMLNQTLHLGGEGLVLRDPSGLYLPERCHHITKVKPFKTAEAVVVGYVTGKETDKGSKLLGKMGAMILDWNGKMFKISGFDYAERELQTVQGTSDKEKLRVAEDWARYHPDTTCPMSIDAVKFPRGTIISFKYRELTDDKIPKEAAYFRKNM